VIDLDGYRLNVGIILSNQDNKLLWARRVGQDSWQFPQGGIMQGEAPKAALLRELHEEVGLTEKDITLLGTTQSWLRYDLPDRLIRHGSKPLCIGQKQIWYLLRIITHEKNINLQRSDKPEFDGWSWVDYWHPLKEVVDFKYDVYHAALSELAPLLFGEDNKDNTRVPENSESRRLVRKQQAEPLSAQKVKHQKNGKSRL